MPRVSTKKKSARGKPYNCGRCSEKIKAGEEYHEWSFRYGGTQRQHASHGFPRGSQLTQSKMSQAHAACEDLEDSLGDGSLDTPDAIADAVQTCMDALQEVMDEYEEAINNMPASEDQNRERIDMLQETYDSLDNVKDYSGEDLEEAGQGRRRGRGATQGRRQRPQDDGVPRRNSGRGGQQELLSVDVCYQFVII